MKTINHLAVIVALLAGYAVAASHQPVDVHTFICVGSQNNQVCPQGGRPDSLVLGSDGNFYGAAQVSTEGTSAPNGGAVWSLTRSGVKVLHTFSPGPNNDYADGNLPGLMSEGSDGRIYGETIYGGNNGCNGYCGYGVLYRINRDGSNFEVVHKYCSEANCTDGEYGGALVTGTDGNLYGTAGGGTGDCLGSGCGVIFRVIPSSGTYEIAFNFNSTTGGVSSSLTVAPDGTFWGITDGSQGEMLFHYVEATGQITTVAMNFPKFNGLPSHGGMLTLGPNGNFYGIYSIYGKSGAGVFEIEPNGSNLQLFPFYTTQDGAGSPQAMLLGTDKNFWVADYNGTDGYGDLISLSPTDGSLIQRLQIFSASAAIGAYPANLMQLPNGAFAGTTMQYGKSSPTQYPDGTIYEFNLGLPPK